MRTAKQRQLQATDIVVLEPFRALTGSRGSFTLVDVCKRKIYDKFEFIDLTMNSAKID